MEHRCCTNHIPLRAEGRQRLHGELPGSRVSWRLNWLFAKAPTGGSSTGETGRWRVQIPLPPFKGEKMDDEIYINENGMCCWRQYCFGREDEAEEFRAWALKHTINASLFAICGTICLLLILAICLL